MTDEQPGFEIPPDTRIGRVALRVGSLDRVLPFYGGLGFQVDRREAGAQLATGDGTELVVLTADPDAPERPRAAAGLFHFAIRVPTRQALADAVARVDDAGLQLTGASDHLVSEAVYLRDPEGNGVEVYRDLPPEDWPRTAEGRVEIDSEPLDLDALEAEATTTDRFPVGTDVGHVHLEVTDLDRARVFYADTLGFRVQAPDHRAHASFLAADDYHHHVGLNAWNDRTLPNGETRGLEWYELVVPDAEATERLWMRVDASQRRGDLAVTDPDGIELRLTVEP